MGQPAGRPAGTGRRLLPRTGDPVRFLPLAAVTAVVLLLAVIGILPRWSGLVHLVGLPPLDLFGDVRILLAEAVSLPAFVSLLALVLAVRVMVLALLLGGLTTDRLWFAARFYLAALPLLLLGGAVDFASYAVLYSRTFWVTVLAVGLVILVMAPAPWQQPAPSPRLRRGLACGLRRGLRLEVTVPYAVIVVGLGALADLGGPGTAVGLVPVSAVATAVAIGKLSGPVPGRPLRRLAVASLVAVLVGATFVVTRADPGPVDPPADRPGSLLIMSGIDSSSGSGSIFETDVASLGYGCDQVYYFSYAGTGDGAPQRDATCPIRTGAPYVAADTLRPFEEQVDLLAAQVRDLPRPLVVAAHSLAAWVAWQAVATGDAPQVDVLVLVGPFPDSPVGYPPAGQNGPGRVAGDLLRALAPLAQQANFHFEPDAPAARRLLATPDAGGAVFAQPLPDRVRALSLTSAADLPLMPGGWRLEVERNACPLRQTHAYLPETADFLAEVNRFLDRRPALPCPPWRDWGAPLARPFGVPPAEPV